MIKFIYKFYINNNNKFVFVILRKLKNKLLTIRNENLFKNQKKILNNDLVDNNNISSSENDNEIPSIILDISNRCSINTLYIEKEKKD